MKKILLIFLFSFFLISCEKYCDQKCGQVMDYGYRDCSSPYGGCTYWLRVKFPDDSQIKAQVDQYTWENMVPGDYICF